MLHALFSLLKQLERQEVELRLQRGHLGLHLHEPRLQICVGNSGRRHWALDLVWFGVGTRGSKPASLKNPTMQTGQHMHLLTGQAFNPRIRWVHMQGYLGLRQPLA